jgi:DNA-binding transcriptional regulator LsrR (DeoR family)
MDISLIGNSALRVAIQRNLVSFPSQIPAFMKRPGGDASERMAHLYFGLGWTVRSICERYGLSKAMVQKMISEWRVRAVAAGYIQDIHPEELDSLVNARDETDTLSPLPAVESAHVAPLFPSDSQNTVSHASLF